jgi:hypothetical protein
MSGIDTQASRILYCHCAYARVGPADVKAAVLNGLAAANVEFDAVPDLCEMAAHRDDRLRELAAAGPLAIAACYPRAVKWLFAAAGAPLSEQSVRIWNMRVESADTVIEGVLDRSRAASVRSGSDDASAAAEHLSGGIGTAAPVDPVDGIDSPDTTEPAS